MTDQEQFEKIKIDGKWIKNVQNPSEKLQYAAVADHPSNIKFIKEPTEAVQMLAVCINPWSLQYIRNPTDYVIQEAARRDRDVLRLIPEGKIPLTARFF
jgi:hypothetical protein